ncbi:MAG TPA: hypothetical protein DF774_17895 [Rheinheimera sp.]|uniref:hypothetical protein n=1 Tax=Rheinheimera sp. TaxID=1869214 RepID=UPI000EBF25A4|nr:hypothetical protein [Rheinheimera sp.]HCU67624.1 hypothetical protein [Rheinheimera sp.]
MKNALLLLAATTLLTACSDSITGQACLGKRGDTLVEHLEGQCKPGDAIATKNPVYFCDFNYSIAYNDYNSAICIYSGDKKERILAE